MATNAELKVENQLLKERLEKLEALVTKKENKDDDNYIPMHRPIRVMTLFNGGLNLKTSNTGDATVFRFVPNFVGNTIPILYSDLVKILANQRSFFEQGYCMILDKEVVKAHYLEEAYEKFIDAETINNMLEYEDDSIGKIFSNVTEVIQQTIVDVIIRKIKENKSVDKNKVDIISKIYGQDIFELANKIR